MREIFLKLIALSLIFSFTTSSWGASKMQFWKQNNKKQSNISNYKVYHQHLGAHRVQFFCQLDMQQRYDILTGIYKKITLRQIAMPLIQSDLHLHLEPIIYFCHKMDEFLLTLKDNLLPKTAQLSRPVVNILSQSLQDLESICYYLGKNQGIEYFTMDNNIRENILNSVFYTLRVDFKNLSKLFDGEGEEDQKLNFNIKFKIFLTSYLSDDLIVDNSLSLYLRGADILKALLEKNSLLV